MKGKDSSDSYKLLTGDIVFYLLIDQIIYCLSPKDTLCSPKRFLGSWDVVGRIMAFQRCPYPKLPETVTMLG